MKKIITSFLLIFLTACSTPNPLTDFRFQTQTVPPHVVASWYKIDAVGEPIKIYIEGDGASFDSAGQPTDNPTPRSAFLRKIAASDPAPNVAYLGRPCQYMQTSACTVTDWTTGRFSPAIVNSMIQSVNALMKKARTDKAVLIGYSGGAQIAGLVAVHQPERIQKVITIAGVLDNQAWTNYHGDMPLIDSMNLATYKSVFDTLPQTHYVGGKDDIVPPVLTQQFVARPTDVVIIKKADHDSGYGSIIEEIYAVQ